VARYSFALTSAIVMLASVPTFHAGAQAAKSSPVARIRHAPTAGHIVRPQSSSGGYIYASNQLSFANHIGSIVYFPTGSTGNVPPTGFIAGSNTQLTQTNGIVVDSRGEIWAAQSDTNAILGFAPGSNGNVAPNAVISGMNTGLASPLAMAIDSADNLYVVNCNECHYGPPGTTSVEEFAAGSSGNVSPIRTISGKRTQLGVIEGIALDAKGSIYVANSFSAEVTVYGRHANGDAQPERVLTGVSVPVGLAVISRNLFITAVDQGEIARYSRKAAGNAQPRSRFAVNWPPDPSGQSLAGIAGAPDGTLYVAGFSAPLIAQYAAKSEGNAQPLAEIEGSNTQLVEPTFVFVR
jgi:sugar lactone lactonase YvrE